MIYESSKDYATGAILMLFDGDAPTLAEIDAFLVDTYGIGVSGSVEVEFPSRFKGLHNPGTIRVNP